MEKRRILFIADNNHYRIWPGKTYYDLLIHIKNFSTKFNITLCWTDDDPTIVKHWIADMKPVLIVFFITGCIKAECREFRFVFDLPIPNACVMLDMFFPYYALEDYAVAGSLVHIGKNKSIVSCYQEMFPKKYVGSFCSRFINTEKFKDYQLEKKYDILIYGNRKYEYPFKKEKLPSVQKFIERYEQIHNTTITEDAKLNFYYLRERLEDVIVKNRSDRYKIKVLPRCGIYNAKVTNEYLSMLINQSRLTIACSTLADVMMHKYLEISASKSVIVGNIPEDYRDLLENNMIEIDYFASDVEILQKIDNALENEENLHEMSSRLYERVHKEHNLDCAITNVENVLSDLCLYHQEKN
jgi:hypothetical protein